MSTLQLSENQVVPNTECSTTESVPAVENIENVQQKSEPDFPYAKLAILDEKISSPRWVVPVLPEQELECLLQASIDLCKKGKHLTLYIYITK